MVGERGIKEGWGVQKHLARPNLKGFILAGNTLDDVETEPRAGNLTCPVFTAFLAPTLSAQHPTGGPYISTGPEKIIPEFLLQDTLAKS